MVNIEDISNWLSQERRWYAANKWMHQQGRMISAATLRRAFRENGRTARQRLAIDLAIQYYVLVNGPKKAVTFDNNVRHTIPV